MSQSNCKVVFYWFSCVTFEVSNKILARKPCLECSSRKQKVKLPLHAVNLFGCPVMFVNG